MVCFTVPEILFAWNAKMDYSITKVVVIPKLRYWIKLQNFFRLIILKSGVHTLWTVNDVTVKDIFISFEGSFQLLKSLSRWNALQVIKSRKQFLEFSILPKTNEKWKKKYPDTSWDIFLFFVRFLEELRIPKISLRFTDY